MYLCKASGVTLELRGSSTELYLTLATGVLEATISDAGTCIYTTSRGWWLQPVQMIEQSWVIRRQKTAAFAMKRWCRVSRVGGGVNIGGGFVADDAGPVQFFMEATNLVLKDDSTAIKNGSNAPGSAEV